LKGANALNDIVVGKYTLESLTTGMYNDPKIVYREYIQNSVDSLEEAIQMKLIASEEMRIDIIIDNENDRISISDNGTGIKATDVYRVLTNIGNSNKRHSSNRGFRGIGRLGGLSYCNKLKFITSYKGEDIKSIVEFDCRKLKEILIPGEYENYDLTKVINVVTAYHEEQEENSKHYFIVEMDGIDSFSALLNMEVIESYIKQIAPLPYRKKFIWKSKIKESFEKNSCNLSEFSIYIGDSKDNLKQLFKPNKDKFIADIKKKNKDEIHDIELFEIRNEKELLAIGWYGESNLYGQIVDKEIIGLRVRKGNILIGDYKVLEDIFKSNRFNGYIQGEVFVTTDRLIPNARRDNFEKNEIYYTFIEILSEKIGDKISKKIREASKNRNRPFSKKIKEVKKVLKEVNIINNEGFNSSVEKNQIKDQVKKCVNEISKLKANDDIEQQQKESIIKELETAVERTKESDNFKIKKVSKIGRKEKKVLKVVTDVLSNNLTKEFVNQIIDEIIAELNKEVKT
jgi:molecular chaperone HtpG